MTPKETAEELFNNYKIIKWIDRFGQEEYESLSDHAAKQCALIAVDQMLWVAEWYERRHKTDSVIQYLNEVKTEIEKL